MAADYVLANPNGITYNGGSILNASRASLVVGRPDIQGGSLKAFTVGANGEQQELRVNGTMSGNSVVDLVAPKVVVSKSANLNAGKINMVTGANKVGYADDKIENWHKPTTRLCWTVKYLVQCVQVLSAFTVQTAARPKL